MTARELLSVDAGEAQYEALRRGTNLRWVGTPMDIFLPTSTVQVQHAVQRALSAGTRVVARSGGHCYEDFTTASDVGTVIDLSALEGISWDAARGAFEVGAGVRLGDLYHQMYRRWGVVLPAGNCPTVAAGGHIVGGGYGSLCRRNGLAVDHLQAVEVVVVDQGGHARTVVATRDDEGDLADLWWAHTGGGGGNFGIATRYWLRSPDTSLNTPSEASSFDPHAALPQAPQFVWVNEVSWAWQDLRADDFATLLQNHGRWHERNSEPTSRARDLFSQLKVWHRSHGSITMDTQIDAAAPNAEQVLLDYTRAVSEGLRAPMTTTQHRKVPWMQATQWAGFTGPDSTTRFKGKSTYLRRAYPPQQIRAMYQHSTRSDFSNPGALLMIASYGGQVNAVAPQATAVAQRDSIIKMQVVSIWHDARDDASNIAWVREHYRDLYADTGGVPVPNEVTDGCFINYADSDLSDPVWNTSRVPWTELYYKENYPRLQQAKRTWDPCNVFQHAQSVQPR
ncbi:FAD-dependent oxidoreductase [Kineococcus arenarius]|uniref:FAD-dependent oxidoreductase n=1 Tax=unclassified Kineococcus TaxID=2621656 RepID=UPI003D7CD143